MRSAFALATFFVAGMNAVDLLMIYYALGGQYLPTSDSAMLQLFWFGARNVFLTVYWLKYVLVFHR